MTSLASGILLIQHPCLRQSLTLPFPPHPPFFFWNDGETEIRMSWVLSRQSEASSVVIAMGVGPPPQTFDPIFLIAGLV